MGQHHRHRHFSSSSPPVTILIISLCLNTDKPLTACWTGFHKSLPSPPSEKIFSRPTTINAIDQFFFGWTGDPKNN
jgi:hypothetical protein